MKFRAVLEEAARGGEGNGGGKDPGAGPINLGYLPTGAARPRIPTYAGGTGRRGGVTRERVGVRGVLPAGIQADEDLRGLHPRYWGEGAREKVRADQKSKSTHTHARIVRNADAVSSREP